MENIANIYEFNEGETKGAEEGESKTSDFGDIGV